MSIRSLIQSFCKSQRGNVVPIFALAIIPIIGLTGMAVDYSRANSLKASIQSALDATALAMAKSAPTLSQQTTPTGANALQDTADKYFKALINHPEATIDPIQATYSSNSGTQLLLTATGRVPTTFTNFMGVGHLDVGSSATIKWGNTRLRVALVLDNTGSMAQSGKIGALKTATTALLTQLKNAATVTEDVYISIIPFVKDVNADPTNYNGTWIDWTEWEGQPPVLDTANGGTKPNSWYTTKQNSNCPVNSNNQGFQCMDRPATASGASTASKVPNSGTYQGLICPSIDDGGKRPLKNSDYYNGCYNTWTACTGSACTCTTSSTSICSCAGTGTAKTCTAQSGYYEHTWRPVTTNSTYTPALALDSSSVPYATPAHSTWNGCTVDRGDRSAPNSGNYDTNVTTPTSSTTATLIAAEQYESCPQAILPLGSPLVSSDWTKMTTLVNAMAPAGNTNQAIGLMHGWMSLVGGGPYPAPPPKDTNYIYNDVIILLTDGLNTQDRWYTDQTSIDTRQQLTCDNINAAKITLYTIQVNTGGDPTSTLLQQCAGSPGKYPDSAKNFVVTASSGIGTVFNQIGTQLSQLRIAK
jgi:Flp pilus assembly protein TadG